MTIQELIEQLSELVEGGEVPTDAEVRLAVQPSYPFEHSVARVAVPELSCGSCGRLAGGQHADGCGDGPGLVGDDLEAGQIVYIGEGQQLGYLRSTARDALGWS